MKQTILSKCFSKMKRFALTLFAALCAGSVWAEEGEATTTPETEPTPTPSALSIDPSAGYIETGLGELKDQVAVVFTNSAAVSTWKAPKNLKNVEFLAVGGGGGGGGHYFKGTSDSTKKYNQGGSGGGGGAVVTGFINELAANASVKIEVGAGGDKGLKTTDPELPTVAGNGGKSVITVNDVVYITAYGGGGDGGFASSGVAIGGSNSGSRGRYEGSSASITAPELANVEYIGAGADVANVVCMRNKGTDGYETNSGAPGGGGGGAVSEGEASTGSGTGGSGGAGYESDITGESKVYGSGGGGGLGKTVAGTEIVGEGGPGAGSAYADGKLAEDALSNQGGGGAGGSFKQDGGNGGSGIVVLRFAYSEKDIVVDVDANVKSRISSKAYTGSELTSGLVSTYAYEVTELNQDDLVNAGKKTVRVTLNDGYVWSDGDTNKSKEFNWYIAAIEPMENGYKVVGLGENGDEVAVVFTNHTKTATWTVPANLRNVEFLVVGGGGGGGADCWDGVAQGGAGGGGGGVIVGLVNFTNGTIVSVNVGKGGTGGSIETRPSSSTYNYWGAAKNDATASDFSVAGVNYVTAYAGGRDQGSSKVSGSGGQVGGAGGSSAGSRPGVSGKGAANPGEVNSAVIISCTKMAHQGGAGNTGADFWGYYSAAGGGGGATENGGTPSDYTTGGKGGEGFASDITGTLLVYGSGGGGGTISRSFGGKGGTGAGDGNVDFYTATSALPNQGGGGGGGGRGDIFDAQSMGVKTSGDGGSGIVVFRYSVYEAEVVTAEGSTPYATFAEAFEAAQAGETVKLLNDVTLAEKLTIKKVVTLDLNGCTLSETVTDNYGALYVGTAGNLTITDSAEGGKIATDGGVVVGNYGTVTVNGGTIEAGENPEVDVSVYNFYYNGSTYGTLTVTGGTVGCIWNCGAVTVAGGTVDYVDTTGEMTVAEGAAIGELLLKIGDYNSELPNKETLVAPETFVVKTLDGSCALYRGGKWVVVDATGNPFLVGETGYATLAAAFDAVDEGGVITLLRDVEGPGLVINKSVTIDFSSKTYTFNQGVGDIPSNGFQILKDNTVTLKNGTLQIAESAKETFYTVIQNYANLTLNNMTVDGTNADKWSATDGDSYAVSLNCGTVSIEGATTITANDEGDKAFAFDVCQYASYTPPTVTLNTTGTISGKVEVSGGDFVYENGTITGGIDFTDGSVAGVEEDDLAIPEDKKLVETDGVYTLADKDVLAKVGDKLFETIDEAFAAAQADDAVLLMKNFAVETVLEIPANVTLDLNGNELQALAVVGKLSMNGGALKTYDTNTQTFFFMAAPAETAGALYWTSDAVMTISADYTLSLDGGSVTLPASWRSLLKQTLTIKSGASFVIPTGVELNLRGNAVVEDGATLTCDGTIALGNTYDAVDTSATLTSAQLAEGKVTSKVEGYRVVYANGVYSLEEIPAEFAAQVGDVKYATLQAALDVEANLAATITLIANTKENVTVPAGFTGTIDLGGFTLTGYVKYTGNGADASVMTLTNGSIHNETTTSAVTVKAAKMNIINVNVYTCKYHGVRVENGGEVVVDGGTYVLENATESTGPSLLYARGESAASTASTAKITVKGGTFITKLHPDNLKTPERYFINVNGPGREVYFEGGVFETDWNTVSTYNVASGGVLSISGGTFAVNPDGNLATGYKVEGTGPYTVVKAWTAPLPEKDGEAPITEEYTLEVLAELEAALATSVDVKVNGVELKGNEAVKALNTAVASFDNAITFDGTAATLDIVIEVTEVNTEDPAASTVVVKRGTEELTVKATPTVKYFYPETKTWGSDKPESGAVLFKLVF